MELLIAYFGTIGALVVFLGFAHGRNADDDAEYRWGEYCLQMVDHIRRACAVLVALRPCGKAAIMPLIAYPRHNRYAA